MPGTRYSVFNPDGESFVPEQDKFNAQLQQMAMQNMGNLAGINEQAREFNIGDSTNRWNAQAEYGLGTQKLAQSGQQFNVLHDLMAKQAMAQLAYQNKSLDAQYEGPRAHLKMEQDQYAEQAPTRAAQNQLTQAQLADLQARSDMRKKLISNPGQLDPTQALLAGGGDPFQAWQVQQDQVRQGAAPDVTLANQLIEKNTPSARNRVNQINAKLTGQGYKGAPVNQQDPLSLLGFAESDPEFKAELSQASNAFGKYAGKADTGWFGLNTGADDQATAGEFTSTMGTALERAKAAGYDPATVNQFARQRLQQALGDKLTGWFGHTRVPYGASNIDKLTQALGLGSVAGSSPLSGGQPPVDSTFGSNQADLAGY